MTFNTEIVANFSSVSPARTGNGPFLLLTWALGLMSGIKPAMITRIASGLVVSGSAAVGGFSGVKAARTYAAGLITVLTQFTFVAPVRIFSTGLSTRTTDLKFTSVGAANMATVTKGVYAYVFAFSMMSVAKIHGIGAGLISKAIATGGFSSIDFKMARAVINQVTNVTNNVTSSIKQFWY
jgi:hypothetical protein